MVENYAVWQKISEAKIQVHRKENICSTSGGVGGGQDQNADVINEQMLTKYIYHNEGFFNILNLKFGGGLY